MKMKRKLLALAVGAALAPGAYAQVTSKAGTNWEFYGKFYPEVVHVGSEGATPTGTPVATFAAAPAGGDNLVHRWEMQISNTYIGFRGDKDIGPGSKAIWQLEQSVFIDEGTGGAFANRDSFVGLANNDWGTIRLGNMDTPFKKFGDTLGFLGVSSGNFVSTSNVLRKIGSGTSSSSSFHLRRANAVDFASPVILGGLQSAVQYSVGAPDEGQITSSPLDHKPRVVSWGVKWERGPFYAAYMNESHLDLFGGSKNANAAQRNDASPGAHSVDNANQVALVYKVGVHSIEADYITKKYREYNVVPTAGGKFQQYNNAAYMLVLENRWSNAWRTAFHYVKATAGSCQLQSLGNLACNADGLGGTQISAGVARYFDPNVYVFVLASRLTNDKSARFNNTSEVDTAGASLRPNDGEDITNFAVGLAYTF